MAWRAKAKMLWATESNQALIAWATWPGRSQGATTGGVEAAITVIGR